MHIHARISVTYWIGIYIGWAIGIYMIRISEKNITTIQFEEIIECYREVDILDNRDHDELDTLWEKELLEALDLQYSGHNI